MTGTLDFRGLLPEQIQGYGLGVMEARAKFYARKRGLDEDRVAVFRPPRSIADCGQRRGRRL